MFIIQVSLCCTIKNEKTNVRKFVDSILSQKRLPDEIIIVDGGSTDGTIDILGEYYKQNPHLIKVIVCSGANIAKGRNIAIREAKNEYIASADVGAVYDKSWLKNLCDCLEKHTDVDIVSGFYTVKYNNLFEECIGILLYPNINMVNIRKFLPSARSIAFKKKVWEELGGYAEWLPLGVGEDTLFAIKAMEKGYIFNYEVNATCSWRPRENLIKLFRQYYRYSRGSVIGGCGCTFLFQAYGVNPIFFTLKNLSEILKKGKIRHLIVSTVILCTVFFAKLSGACEGIIRRLIKISMLRLKGEEG